ARHYPALALAVVPALAYLATIFVKTLGRQELAPEPALLRQTLFCLANGFIVTSLLWAAALAALLDGRLRKGAVYLVIAGVCAYSRTTPSPFDRPVIGLPQDVLGKFLRDGVLPEAIRYQTPYHWTAAYGLAGALLAALSFLPGEGKTEV